jgi:hypothetical protein
MDAKTKPAVNRKVIVAVAAGMAAVLAAAIVGVVLLTLQSRDDGRAAATTFFQALKDGDAEKALSVSDPGVPDDEMALLQDSVYKSAGQRIDGFRILEAKSEYVSAEVTQQGRKQENTLLMTKSKDGQWKVGPTNFQKILLSSSRPVKSFTVNGVDVKVPDAGSAAQDSGLRLPAFPGEYTLGISGDKYTTAEEQKSLVSIDRMMSDRVISLEVAPSKLLLDETQTVLEKKWGECIAASTNNASGAIPSGCSSFRLSVYRPTRNVKWTIEKKPTFTLGRVRDGWYIQSGDPGKASVSYEVNNSYDTPKWESKGESVTLKTTGEIQIVDDKVTLKQ